MYLQRKIFVCAVNNLKNAANKVGILIKNKCLLFVIDVKIALYQIPNKQIVYIFSVLSFFNY